LGVYENGEVWTNVAGLGAERAKRLASELAKQQVLLDVTKEWALDQCSRKPLHASPSGQPTRQDWRYRNPMLRADEVIE